MFEFVTLAIESRSEASYFLAHPLASCARPPPFRLGSATGGATVSRLALLMAILGAKWAKKKMAERGCSDAYHFSIAAMLVKLSLVLILVEMSLLR